MSVVRLSEQIEATHNYIWHCKPASSNLIPCDMAYLDADVVCVIPVIKNVVVK